MNILLTGCTSQQCNPDSNRNITNYAGLLRRAFHLCGHEVTWAEPSISWRGSDLLHQYDHIVVGLAPVTSLSANRVYGALSVIGQIMDSNPRKLSILVDAPQPDRIAAGARAMLAHPDNLTKMFYSYRKEYELACRSSDRLLRIIERLHEEPWPTTIAPVLPWQQEETRLPYLTRQTISLNLDTLLYQGLDWDETHHRENVWTTEGLVKRSVIYPSRPVLHKGHASRDQDVMRQMSTGIGTLLESPKEGLWWNTRYVQSLVTDTPVFSNWRETQALGSMWSILPTSIENITANQRTELARDQLSAYRAVCPDLSEIKQQIYSILKVKAKASV